MRTVVKKEVRFYLKESSKLEEMKLQTSALAMMAVFFNILNVIAYLALIDFFEGWLRFFMIANIIVVGVSVLYYFKKFNSLLPLNFIFYTVTSIILINVLIGPWSRFELYQKVFSVISLLFITLYIPFWMGVIVNSLYILKTFNPPDRIRSIIWKIQDLMIWVRSFLLSKVFLGTLTLLAFDILILGAIPLFEGKYDLFGFYLMDFMYLLLGVSNIVFILLVRKS